MQEKQENMKQLLLPIATEFKDLLVSLSSEQDMMKQTDIARRLYNCMSLARYVDGKSSGVCVHQWYQLVSIS